MPKKSITPSAKRTKASFKISNDGGVHTRPAAALVKCAQKFPAAVTIYKGRTSADGKSILKLLSLGIKKGDAITIKTRGAQAPEALRALGQLIRRRFYE